MIRRGLCWSSCTIISLYLCLSLFLSDFQFGVCVCLCVYTRKNFLRNCRVICMHYCAHEFENPVEDLFIFISELFQSTSFSSHCHYNGLKNCLTDDFRLFFIFSLYTSTHSLTCIILCIRLYDHLLFIYITYSNDIYYVLFANACKQSTFIFVLLLLPLCIHT